MKTFLDRLHSEAGDVVIKIAVAVIAISLLIGFAAPALLKNSDLGSPAPSTGSSAPAQTSAPADSPRP